MKRWRIRFVSFFITLGVIMALCWFFPIILFDPSTPALIEDEDVYEASALPVALGPHPRFLAPTKQNSFYTGDEWIFRFYSSYCRQWRIKNGYAPPRWHRDRKDDFPLPH